MLVRLSEFAANEDGAITVDWVVLTAGVVALGAIVYLNFIGPIRHVDSQSGAAIANIEVKELVLE